MNCATLEYSIAKNGLGLVLKRYAVLGVPGVKKRQKTRLEEKVDAEYRQAAFFAYCRYVLSADASLCFAIMREEQNQADMVLRRMDAYGKFHYEMIQLKELVPEEVCPDLTLQNLIDGIVRKYGAGASIIVAINLNRDVITDLHSIVLPVGAENYTFWLYGLAEQNRAFIVANPFHSPAIHDFKIPRLPSSITQW